MNTVVSYTRDISTGGLFLIGDHGFETGQQVTVALSTPSSWEPIRLQALVCWTAEDRDDIATGVGLKFIDLSQEELSQLAQFVDSLEFGS